MQKIIQKNKIMLNEEIKSQKNRNQKLNYVNHEMNYKIMRDLKFKLSFNLFYF